VGYPERNAEPKERNEGATTAFASRQFGLISRDVTTPTRTLVDLCGVVEPDRVEPALDDALRRGLTSLPRLWWAAARLGGRGRSGARRIRELLEERSSATPIPANVFETRVKQLLAKAGLPEPEAQFEDRGRGRLLARVDFAYPDLKLAIRADSYRYHSGRMAWQRDLARRNSLASRGWRVLHVTWEDLMTQPDALVAEIHTALIALVGRRI